MQCVIKGLHRPRETETSKEMEAVQDLSEAVSGRVVCDLIKYYRRYEKWKNCEWRRFIIYIFLSLPPTAKPNAKELGKEIKCCKMERIDATNTKNGIGTYVVRMLRQRKVQCC